MRQLNKPRIKIPLTKFDWLMEFLCASLLIFNWLYTILNYGRLPEIIPTHFNFSGSVDGFGNKSSVFVLPIIEVFLYLLLTIIGRFPHLHNYLTTITAQNAIFLYAASSRMLRWLKLFIILIFSVILIQIVHTANQSFLAGFPFILPILFIGTIIIIISFLLQTSKYKTVTS